MKSVGVWGYLADVLDARLATERELGKRRRDEVAAIISSADS